MNAAHSMQLEKSDAKIGIQLKSRPVRVSVKPSVCVFMAATSAQTPKISARRRQVTKGGAGLSTILGISEPQRREATHQPVPRRGGVERPIMARTRSRDDGRVTGVRSCGVTGDWTG